MFQDKELTVHICSSPPYGGKMSSVSDITQVLPSTISVWFEFPSDMEADETLGSASDKLSLSGSAGWRLSSMLSSKKTNQPAAWPGTMKCTISPGSIALGFLKGKKAIKHRTLCSL